MSHAATNWAIRQRGLKPAAKIVLWQLADRHNADTGRCDPDQAILAADCEMSRSTLNLHLTDLERRGLIQRVPRIDERTKRQLSTFYRLAFDTEIAVSENRTRAQDVVVAVSEIETRPASGNRTRPVSEKPAEPCPKNGESRVRKSDTNPVREPGREERKSARAPEAPFEVPDRTQDQDRFPEFWAAYPRKEARLDAEAEFITATIRTDAETIVAGARAFAARSAGQELRFLPLPAKWIAKRRWTDEAPPPTTGDPDREAKLKRLRRIAAEYEAPP